MKCRLSESAVSASAITSFWKQARTILCCRIFHLLKRFRTDVFPGFSLPWFRCEPSGNAAPDRWLWTETATSISAAGMPSGKSTRPRSIEPWLTEEELFLIGAPPQSPGIYRVLARMDSFPFRGQTKFPYTETAWEEDRATQEWDPSAVPGPEWMAALPPPPFKLADPPKPRRKTVQALGSTSPNLGCFAGIPVRHLQRNDRPSEGLPGFAEEKRQHASRLLEELRTQRTGVTGYRTGVP